MTGFSLHQDGTILTARLCWDHSSPEYVKRWCSFCAPPDRTLLPGWAELVH
jgi:hypothetical protein